MATLNIGLKVNRAITGATTVNANAYAMVTYSPSFAGTVVAGGTGYTGLAATPITRFFGPGQSIPASFTTTSRIGEAGSVAASTTTTWSLQSGVELINTQ